MFMGFFLSMQIYGDPGQKRLMLGSYLELISLLG